jgi:hypothetical protein
VAGIVYKLMKEQGERQACTFTLFLELYSMDPCAEKTKFSSRAECRLSTMRRISCVTSPKWKTRSGDPTAAAGMGGS